MAIKTRNQPETFVSGRGNVSENVAKSNEDVLHEESEVMEEEGEGVNPGKDANDMGAKPIFATGEMPFHEGRGLGRGHGPETK